MAERILNEGYHVWLSDIDVIFVHDPWPVIQEWSLGVGCDYIFQPNGAEFPKALTPTADGNTGFRTGTRGLRKSTRLNRMTPNLIPDDNTNDCDH